MSSSSVLGKDEPETTESPLSQALRTSDRALGRGRTLAIGSNCFSARLIVFDNIEAPEPREDKAISVPNFPEVEKRLRSFLPRSE